MQLQENTLFDLWPGPYETSPSTFYIMRSIVFVCFVALHPSQQLWSLQDDQFT